MPVLALWRALHGFQRVVEAQLTQLPHRLAYSGKEARFGRLFQRLDFLELVLDVLDCFRLHVCSFSKQVKESPVAIGGAGSIT